MKLLIGVLSIVIATSCCSKSKIAKKNASTQGTEALTLPSCVLELIRKVEADERQNPPIKIYSYKYQDSLVYYVTAPCCDFFSDLYNSRCELLGHPDGGITGRGDGKIPNFAQLATDQKLIWEDKRQEKKY